ncbi:hypothetical protein GWI34_18470 [Actinomadura sp. DSM 109109]|nr:hypothetical protein [Actinomadura lepetitiana]
MTARSVLPPILERRLRSITEWWERALGEVPPVLVLAGPRTAEKRILLDAFAAEILHRNDGLPPADRVAVARAEADGPVSPDVARLLDRLRPDGAGEGGRWASGVILIDSYDGFAVTHPAVRALNDPSALDRAGLRIVLGRIAPAVGPETARCVVPPYVHRRDALLRHIGRWAADLRDEPVLVVRGRPGSGKTELLAAAARELAAGTGADGPLLLSHLLGTPADRSQFRVEDLVAEGCRALPADPPPSGGVDITPLIREARVDARDVTGDVYGLKVDTVSFHTSPPGVETLRARLDARAAAKGTPRPLVFVVDALDELLEAGGDAAQGLYSMVAASGRLRSWGVKFLVSAHELPGVPGAVIDLDRHPDAVADLRDYADRRLAEWQPDAPVRQGLAARIAEHSGGLFIVASGWLDEAEERRHGDLATDLAGSRPVAGAADYFVGAVGRLVRGAAGSGAPPGRALDMLRFLRVLALVPTGMTAAEIAAVWQADAGEDGVVPAGTSQWREVANTIGRSPAARYLIEPDDHRHGRYRLIHPSVREALLRPDDPAGLDTDVAHSGVSLRAERLRFLRALTPVHGAGPAWDPDGGRLALAHVLDVLADLLAEALAARPPEEDLAEKARRLIRTVLEDWSWLEACVTGYRAQDEIRLGAGMVVDALSRLSALPGGGFDSGEASLWDGPEWTAEALDEPAAREVRREAPPPGRRPGPPARRPAKRPKYPSVETPRGAELAFGYERRPTREEALARLRQVSAEYTPARPPLGTGDPERPVLWFRGFQVTAEEGERGYKGNYVQMEVEPREGGQWGIKVEKIPIPLSRHPDRGRPGHPHPNWGHPILRGAVNNLKDSNRKPWRYRTRELAERDLKALKDEFPRTAIMNDGLLLIQVFQRNEDGSKGVVKIGLRVVPRSGWFVLEVFSNDRKPESGD